MKGLVNINNFALEIMTSPTEFDNISKTLCSSFCQTLPEEMVPIPHITVYLFLRDTLSFRNRK